MKIKVFTDSDLDGVSCGIVAQAIFGKDTDVTHCTPKDIDGKLVDFINKKEYENYDKIFITDLVIKDTTGNLIDTTDRFKFKLFDHHRSNFVNSKYTWANVYEQYNGHKTCGAELFWNHLKEYYGREYVAQANMSDVDVQHTDVYIEFVRLWDTWDWISAEDAGIYAKKLNTLLNIYSKTKFVNVMIDRLSADNSESILSETDEMFITAEETRKHRYINQKIKNVRIHEYNGLRFAYVFAENYVSELGNYIAKNVKDISFAAIINADTHVVSMRAIQNSDIDLAAIAKTFSKQGGGHAFSAGFIYNPIIETDMVNNIFK